MSSERTWFSRVKGSFGMAWRVLPAFFLISGGVALLFATPQEEYPVIRVALAGSGPFMAAVLLFLLSIALPGLFGAGEFERVLVFSLPVLYVGSLAFFEFLVVGNPFGPFSQLDQYPGQPWSTVWPWLLSLVGCLGWSAFARRWTLRGGQ